MIKLIGLKSIFDIINGQINSTYGDIYTILGLIYIYTPFMIMPIFSALQTLPKNLINASKDLGRNNFYTFINITIPWCKTAIISGITLVLLPCFTTVIVSGFMNNNNDGSLIGSVIMNQGDSGLNSKIALARTSVLVLVVSCVTLSVYLTLVYIPKLYFFIKHKMVKKNEK
ncbi:ABC transporter permease subunit [bacterium]|nr:ABC transporter permease subunit [bacterium]